MLQFSIQKLMHLSFEGDRVLLQSLTRAKRNKFVCVYFVILLRLVLLTVLSSPSIFDTSSLLVESGSWMDFPGTPANDQGTY
jgi:hypothetical protein